MYYICITTCGANKSGLRTSKGMLVTVDRQSLAPYPNGFGDWIEVIEGPLPMNEVVRRMDSNAKTNRLYLKWMHRTENKELVTWLKKRYPGLTALLEMEGR